MPDGAFGCNKIGLLKVTPWSQVTTSSGI